jgi:antitoxin (DNA-binding transcriptional repressor) of toxin-antitoxin stability system
MEQVPTTELKNRPGPLWARVAAGERIELVRGRSRTPVARLVQVQDDEAVRYANDQLWAQVGRLVQAITGDWPGSHALTVDQMLDLTEQAITQAAAVTRGA